jgi:hypothetical protein
MGIKQLQTFKENKMQNEVFKGDDRQDKIVPKQFLRSENRGLIEWDKTGVNAYILN